MNKKPHGVNYFSIHRLPNHMVDPTVDKKTKELRSYRRRSAIKKSGFHTCGESTGGECLIERSTRIPIHKGINKFIFKREGLMLVDLFGKDLGIIAFGGFIYVETKIKYCLEMKLISKKPDKTLVNTQKQQESNDWIALAIHQEIDTTEIVMIDYAEVILTIISEKNDYIDAESFDFDIVDYSDYQDPDLQLYEAFHQKTSMSAPYLYYGEMNLDVSEYLETPVDYSVGRWVVRKSCNRCNRYIPINEPNELNKLGYALHCKKNAPCTHTLFHNYKIENIEDLKGEDLSEFTIDDDELISYYGHQLECRACKKFYVNLPLNPMRDSQQHREDSLRRRALEVLVDELLGVNTIHMEFKRKGDFSNWVWVEFGKQCFNCGKELKTVGEMDLDHTMPLAYLYRLDESATCLCKECNSMKHDHFPVDYYSEEQLVELSKITGLSMETLKKREINTEVLEKLIENIVWYFDVFLMKTDYQKVRKGILTADKINDSLKRVIAGKYNLAEEYKKRTGRYPTSITMRSDLS